MIKGKWNFSLEEVIQELEITKIASQLFFSQPTDSWKNLPIFMIFSFGKL